MKVSKFYCIELSDEERSAVADFAKIKEQFCNIVESCDDNRCPFYSLCDSVFAVDDFISELKNYVNRG